MTTAYDVLGVDCNADGAAIKAAFRRAAKECHPDLNEGDRNGERLRLLLAARAAALSSLKQLERKSRDFASKAAGKKRSSLLAGAFAGSVGLLFLPVILQRLELASTIRPSQTTGTLHISTQVPGSREKGLANPPVGSAETPAETSEIPPSFDAVDADETGRLVAAGRGKAGWIIRLMSGTQAVGETTADEQGEWVLIPDEPLALGNHALSLLEFDPISKRGISGLRSITVFIALPQTRDRRQAAK